MGAGVGAVPEPCRIANSFCGVQVLVSTVRPECNELLGGCTVSRGCVLLWWVEDSCFEHPGLHNCHSWSRFLNPDSSWVVRPGAKQTIICSPDHPTDRAHIRSTGAERFHLPSGHRALVERRVHPTVRCRRTGVPPEDGSPARGLPSARCRTRGCHGQRGTCRGSPFPIPHPPRHPFMPLARARSPSTAAISPKSRSSSAASR